MSRNAQMLRRVSVAMMALVVAASSVWAQTPVVSTGRAKNQMISVEVNKGYPLRLAQPAASVAIANPKIADVQVVSPQLLFINGVMAGETSLIAVDANDNVIMQGTVNVTHNLSRFERAAHSMAPLSSVTASSTDNAIILSGQVDSPVTAEKLQRLANTFLASDQQQVINMMDTSGSDQVMLKVRIVELARTEFKKFGINWENIVNRGSFMFGLGQGRNVMDVDEDTGQRIYQRDPEGANSIFFGDNSDPSRSMNAAIDALEGDGLVTVLAEPNLTTRSGMTASFLAGGEIPIPVPGENGTVSINYRQFGVSLQFTPIVLSKDKISLTVMPEVSALSEANSITGGDFGTIPSISTRRASTTVDLGSGQTFAIAGLLRNDQSNQISKFPMLGDVPILGALFGSTQFRNNQSELVILVTPYVVKPIDDASKLATPLDGYKPANDFERILLGHLSGHSEVKPDSKASAKTPTAARAPLPGDVFGGMNGQAGFLVR